MKTALYDELVQLCRAANDQAQTAEARKLASDKFEQLAQTDPAMKKIILDAIANAPSTQASILYTYRAALTDYSETKSVASAIHTFFKVANTRLHNPSEAEQLRPQG
ncbi:hypothetical protein ACNVED_15320 (plasmid) [Legionella sp. D16C41]|uniref:hypothetical protein n=1 Tax=Legionella sp. D16C41 TaxID=3402688 RepID=UPI003AF6537D